MEWHWNSALSDAEAEIAEALFRTQEADTDADKFQAAARMQNAATQYLNAYTEFMKVYVSEQGPDLAWFK